MRDRNPARTKKRRQELRKNSTEAVNKRTPSVFPFKRGRTPWIETNHAESPPPDAGGDRGGLL